MLFTENYQLASVVAGETLDPLEDSRRFLVIDRQLLGLFQVFGNGVISGWDVSDAGGLSVAISPGTGNVYYMSAQTTVAATVTGLVPNSTNYVYAQATNTTRFDRGVAFVSDVVLFGAGQQILLAKVVTGASGISSIDMTVRNDIGYIATIKGLINAHRHRGLPDNPTKIDLSQEVTGQLPGYRIDGLDASLIRSGRIPSPRLPLIAHGDLEDAGVLTHAQLDTFVRDLSNPNARLLGEIGSVNLMQLYLAFKHIWNEVDTYATNLLVMVPGITNDAFTDYAATTAVVDKANHTIQGVPSLGGQLVTASFSTQQDFLSATLESNIQVGTDNTGPFFTLTRPVTELIVEDFSDVFSNGSAIPGWTLTTIAAESTTSFLSDDTEKVDGAYSAKLSVDQQMRVQVTKAFATPQDWTGYNELDLYVQTLSADHGKIVFQTLTTVAGQYVEVDSFTLLEPNQTTTSFLKVTRDISNVTRNSITAINIYTDTALGWDLSAFALNIDSIELNNNLYFSPTGLIRFRLQGPQASHWAAISWAGDPNGGTIEARARTAPSYATFDQSNMSVFSPFIATSGADPNVPDNRAIELEVDLVAASGNASAPVVRSVTVSYITNAVSGGLTIDTTAEWLRATQMENAEVIDIGGTPDLGQVQINGRNDTGDVVYGTQYGVQQASIGGSAFGTVYATPVAGFGGGKLPLSPYQATQTNYGYKTSSFGGCNTVIRQQDRTYIVTDTLNDRIVVFDKDGNPLSGLMSNNVANVADLYPIGAVYNPTSGTLYVPWSMPISLASMDLSQITISGAGLSITLSNLADTVSRIAAPNAQAATSNVSPIVLSVAHAGEISQFLGSASTLNAALFVSIGPTAAKEGVNTSAANYATLLTPRGLPLFVGDFAFCAGIYHPIGLSITAAGNWLVANAKPLLTTTTGSSGASGASGNDPLTGMPVSNITSTIEFVPSTGSTAFSDNSLDYSMLSLGNAIEINSDYVAVAGIVSKSGAATSSSGQSSDLAVLTGSRVGTVNVIEKSSGLVVSSQNTSDGTFAADVQVDEDGNLVIVEKSFANGLSQGRVVKIDQDGNVFFQFGLAEMASPNDVRVLSTGNMVVST